MARARAAAESSHPVTEKGGELGVPNPGLLKIAEMCKGEHGSFAVWSGCQGKAGRGAFMESACLPSPTVSKPSGEKLIVENSLHVIPLSVLS